MLSWKVPLLPRWLVSPLYLAIIVSVRGAVPDGVYVAWHVAGPLVLNVHGEPVKTPVPPVMKVTVPDGARGLPTSLSVTVAVHDVV